MMPPAWHAFVAAWLDVPFAWGVHDCALMAAAAIEAQTGCDHGVPYRGAYDDARGALAALAANGVRKPRPETLAASLLEPVAIGRARRGDVLAFTPASLGVCLGGGQALAFDRARPGGRAIVMPRGIFRRAYRVRGG